MTTETPESHHREESIVEAVSRGIPQALADLGDLVRIPGIAWPSFDQVHLERSAELIAQLAKEIEFFDRVTIERASVPGGRELGQPAVLATRAAKNGKPTIVLYAHHDVQPPGDEELWNTPPFEPTVINGRMYARGAADDKAGVMTHIAALRAVHSHLQDDFDLGVTLFIEGEEEYGSRSFAQFLKDHRRVLEADAIVVADSGNWDAETPGLTVSLRGMTRFTVTVKTLDHALHSGMFGGAVPDAPLVMIKLLSTLWDDHGSLQVAGLKEWESVTVPLDDQILREQSGLLKTTDTIGEGPLLGRIWNKPSVTVIGMDMTPIASASNTLQPEVSAVLTARIAPGQDSHEAYQALERHLRENTPFGAEISFSDHDFGDGFLVDTDGWVVEITRQAMADAYGTEPVDLGVGGSIPFIADLVREFPRAQVLVTGVEDPDARAHSPNESLHLDTFRKSVLTEAFLLTRMNEHG